MTPQEVLIKHKDFFEWVERTQECSDGSENRVQEIWAAFKSFNPHYVMDWCCASCVFRMIKQADELRKTFEPKHYTFPKQG